MIQVINRALDILEFIGNDPAKPKTLSEIANTLQLNAGTCANIIKTLTSRRYIQKADNKKGYILGSAAYKLAGSEGYNKELIDVTRQELSKLTKTLNENSEIAVLNNDLRIVLFRIFSSHDLQVRPASEKRAYGTASGIIMLACLPDADLQKFVDLYGLPTEDEWGSAVDEQSFYAELARIKKNNYAIRKTKDDIIGIAVPLYKNGIVIAALGVYVPIFRYEMTDKKAILNEIVKTGNIINEKLK